MSYTENQRILVHDYLIPLCEKAGLDLDVWDVKFTRHKTKAGMCNYSKKMFYFSTPVLEAEGIDVFYPTVIHEVAHAVISTRYDGMENSWGVSDHGQEWKEAFISLGGDPALAHAAREVKGTLTYLWEGVCPQGHTVQQHRTPTKLYSCFVCSPERFNTDYLFVWYKKGELVPMHDKYIGALAVEGLPSPYPTV